MAEQEEISKSGCFNCFFRLLLCAPSTNAPPIHPSDHLPPPQPLPSLPNKPNPVSPTPGLVARLMGLDSLPNTSRVSSRVAPDSVPRSKSVNFIDYLLHFDPVHQEQEGSHRRVRTSSFREVPVMTSLSFQPTEKNNGDVVVFLWDDDVETTAARESRPGGAVRHSSRELQEVGCLKESKKQRKENNEGTRRRRKKISKLKNEPRRRASVSRDYGSGSLMSPRMRKDEFFEPRFRKNIGTNKSSSSPKKKKMQNQRCSENLSPVSVLDVADDEQGFPLQKETNFTEETNGMALKSKGESSAEGGSKSNNHKSESEECSELMANLRKLSENDVHQMFGCDKGVFGSNRCFDEIPSILEHKIFDLLLREVVHEILTL